MKVLSNCLFVVSFIEWHLDYMISFFSYVFPINMNFGFDSQAVLAEKYVEKRLDDGRTDSKRRMPI